MEEVVLRSLRSLVGWDEGDGIFCPGGSISNMYAMNVARYWAFPQVKTQGLWSVPRLAVFTSQEVKIRITGFCLNKHHHNHHNSLCFALFALCLSPDVVKIIINRFAMFLAKELGKVWRQKLHILTFSSI